MLLRESVSNSSPIFMVGFIIDVIKASVNVVFLVHDNWLR